MLTGILQNTPYWVWGIFVLLLVLGLVQTRRRRAPRLTVFILPVVMIPLSFSAIAVEFGVKPLPVIAWLCGIALAFALNSFVFKAPSGVRYFGENNTFEIPGSWIPLILMMTIFLARFVVGFTKAVNPALTGTDVFAGIVSLVLGFCSGLFAARALKTIVAPRSA